MNLLSNNVNTRSHSNNEEDFKKHISGMKEAYEELNKVVNKYGSLVYDVDLVHREKLRDYQELLIATIKRMHREVGYFPANIYQEVFGLYCQLANLAVKANRHDFLIDTSQEILIWSDFILQNTK